MLLRILLLGALVLGLGLASTPAASAHHVPDCETGDVDCLGAWGDYWTKVIYNDLKDPPCTCDPNDPW